MNKLSKKTLYLGELEEQLLVNLSVILGLSNSSVVNLLIKLYSNNLLEVGGKQDKASIIKAIEDNYGKL